MIPIYLYGVTKLITIYFFIHTLLVVFNLQSNSLRIIVIYSPRKPDFSIFFNKYYDLINDCLYHNENKVMIVGEFNFHFNSSSKPHSLFKQLTEYLGLHQHLNCPTQVSGNIKSYIYSKRYSSSMCFFVFTF